MLSPVFSTGRFSQAWATRNVAGAGCPWRHIAAQIHRTVVEVSRKEPPAASKRSPHLVNRTLLQPRQPEASPKSLGTTENDFWIPASGTTFVCVDDEGRE
ncbi:hypothetical protein CYLTODRAFT_422847 [Cylindrobasidium torrendii FP15055 ss-10]|uniref:Uncharacterized protein n=1 Tax=Cylindrobasidium torrendii FP15055 ss-10 TaxID=1314674 RepID=A0A0D7B990_9AGAR|nr:hypothetical protein CYLTODRAFT_422847 [Cylindrobasidium torrendii FP15055 ss-10]